MILITGATGLLGSYIARYLVAAGLPVRAIKRATSDLSLLAEAKDKIEWVEGDVLDIPSLEDAFVGVTHIYHSAAAISFNKKERDRMLKINIEGTANVVNVAIDMGVQRLLHVSSVAALGKGKTDTMLNEDAVWEDSPYDTGYGLSKYMGELEVWRGMVEGLDSVIINPSTILGAGRWSDSSTRIFSKVEEGLSFYPKGSNGYVDVRDVAQVAIKVMDSNISNKRFVVSAENLKYQQLIDSISDNMGTKRPSIAVSGPLLTLSWMFEGIKSKITGGEPVITKEVAQLTSQNYLYDNTALLSHIDHDLIPIERTVKETIIKLKESRAKGQELAVFDL